MTDKRRLLLKALVSTVKAERDDALAILEIILDGTDDKYAIDNLNLVLEQLTLAENKLKVLNEHFKVSTE